MILSKNLNANSNFSNVLLTTFVSALFGIFLSLPSQTLAVPADFDFSGTFVNDNDVAYFNFSLEQEREISIFTSSWQNAQDGGGFDPVLSLWSSTGQLLVQQDDGFEGATVSNGTQFAHGVFDTFYTDSLDAGDYIATIVQYDNFAISDDIEDGFTHDDSPSFTSEVLELGNQERFNDANDSPRTGFWRLHFLDVDSATLEDELVLDDESINEEDIIPVAEDIVPVEENIVPEDEEEIEVEEDIALPTEEDVAEEDIIDVDVATEVPTEDDIQDEEILPSDDDIIIPTDEDINDLVEENDIVDAGADEIDLEEEIDIIDEETFDEEPTIIPPTMSVPPVIIEEEINEIDDAATGIGGDSGVAAEDTEVPEPSSVILLLTALMGFGYYRRK